MAAERPDATGDPTVDEIRIPNRATYTPVALADVILIAPLASRVLLGATLPGRLLQLAALGAYAGSALTDWQARRESRRIDFLSHFGADVRHLTPMSREAREREVAELVASLNAEYGPLRLSREEVAARANRHLTEYIAGITGQRVETSDRVRDFMLAGLFFPFALGACDRLSGDVAIFRPVGVFEPHLVAHEFVHRKGYVKELEAQALAYLALEASGDPPLVQAARCERLYRQLCVLAGGDARRYHELLDGCGLRPELESAFRARHPVPGRAGRAVLAGLRRLYEERMRLTGQNGLSDYDEGFTSFLHAVEARQAG